MKPECSQAGNSKFRETLRKSAKTKILVIILGIIGVIVAATFSIVMGSYAISPAEAFGAIWDRIVGNPAADKTIDHIVVNLRLPRILSAVVCGFALAVCGVAMQSMLKNPLADPYTMGISSGASFGAAIALILGIEVIAGGGVIINAFVFALIPSFVILFLSKFRKATPTMMVLCGIAVMYMFNALTQLFMLIADLDDMAAVYQWTVGSIDGVDYGKLMLMLPVVMAGSLYIMYAANQLNVMGIGDESAKTLGINVDRKRLVFLIVVALVAAAVVSFTGVIGFIGLVAPHMLRTIIGSDNKYLIPAAGVFGSLILVVSDIVSRFIADPIILPVGVITSCIGGPLFLYLVMRNTREVWS